MGNCGPFFFASSRKSEGKREQSHTTQRAERDNSARPGAGRPTQIRELGNVDRFELSNHRRRQAPGGGTVRNSKRGAGSPLGSAQLSAPLKGRRASRGSAAGGGPAQARAG